MRKYDKIFFASVIWNVWLLRNRSVFDDLQFSYSRLISHISSFFYEWTGVHLDWTNAAQVDLISDDEGPSVSEEGEETT